MKKEEMKEIVKEAVLEALMQFTTGGVATAAEPIVQPGDDEEPTRPEEGEGEGEGDDDDDKKKDPILEPNLGLGPL